MRKPLGLVIGATMVLVVYLCAFGTLTARDQRRHWPDQAVLYRVFAPCWRLAESGELGEHAVDAWLRLFGYHPLQHTG